MKRGAKLKYINKNGSSLIYVIVMFSVLMIFGSFLLKVSVVESQQFKRVEHQNNAYYVAKSAIESTSSIFTNRLNENLDFLNRVNDLEINDTIVLSVPYSIKIGEGEANIVITKISKNQIKIDGEGQYENQKAQASLFLDFSKSNSYLDIDHALFAKGSLNVSGADSINGTVASNGKITVSNGNDTTMFIDDDGSYEDEEYILNEANGLLDEYSENTYHNVVEGDLPKLSLSDISEFKESKKIVIDKSSEFDSIVAKDIEFVIPDEDEALVIVVNDIDIKGNIKILDDEGDAVEEAGDGMVKIYVRNSAKFQTPKDMVNHPSNFIIICLSREPNNSNDYSIEISGNSTFQGIVYAPGTLAKIQTKAGKKSQAFVGAMIADQITIQGQADIIFKDPEFDEDFDITNNLVFEINHWE